MGMDNYLLSPYKMKSTELIVKIIAWVDIVISSLCFCMVAIFTLILLLVPEFLQKMVAEDLDADDMTNHPQIDKFIQLGGELQFLLVFGLLLFWGIYLMFSVLLLRWAKRRYLLGSRVYFVFRLAKTVLFFPLDLYWIVPTEEPMSVEPMSVVFFVILIAYDVFALWAVWTLIRYIVSVRGESRQIVEFQAL